MDFIQESNNSDDISMITRGEICTKRNNNVTDIIEDRNSSPGKKQKMKSDGKMNQLDPPFSLHCYLIKLLCQSYYVSSKSSPVLDGSSLDASEIEIRISHKEVSMKKEFHNMHWYSGSDGLA